MYDLKHGLPTRNNKAGLARGYSDTPPRGVAACPPGGCPPNWLSSDDALLAGFDRDFVELIFERMLALPVTFRTFGNFPELWMVRSAPPAPCQLPGQRRAAHALPRPQALLQGYVDVVVTASNVDPKYALCGEDGPATEYAYTYDCAPAAARAHGCCVLPLTHALRCADGYMDYANSEAPFSSSDCASAPRAALLATGAA